MRLNPPYSIPHFPTGIHSVSGDSQVRSPSLAWVAVEIASPGELVHDAAAAAIGCRGLTLKYSCTGMRKTLVVLVSLPALGTCSQH